MLTSTKINPLETFLRASHLEYRKGWNNFSNTQNQSKALVVKVKNLEQLTELKKKAYQLNQTGEEKITLRIAAGGMDEEYSDSFSFTGCVSGSEDGENKKTIVIANLVSEKVSYVGAPKKKRKPENTFQQIYFASEEDRKNNIVTVGASVMTGHLDDVLWKSGLCTPTSSLIPYVTVAGLLANAGHGTGRDQPAFAGLVEEMTFMLENGDIVTINHSDPDAEKIFGAHLGLFGTLLTVKLRCQPAPRVEIKETPVTLDNLLDQIKTGLFDKNPMVSVMHMPTYDGAHSPIKNTLVITMSPIDPADASKEADLNYNPCLDIFTDNLEVKLAEEFQITDFINQFGLTPYYMQYMAVPVAIGTEERTSRGPWPMVHYQHAFPEKINDIDWLIPMKKSADIAAVVEKLQQLLQKYADKKQYPLNYAVYLRYFSGTNGGLSTSTHQNGEHVLGIDVVSTPNTPGYAEFRKEWNDFCASIGGKPHWGKDVPEDFDVAKAYGVQLEKTLDARACLYKKHQIPLENSMLVNPFLEKIIHPQIMPTKQVRSEKVIPADRIVRVADEALKCIKGDHAAAEKLRKKILKIRTQFSAGQNPNTTFGGGNPSDAATPPANNMTPTKGCGTCNIL